MDKTVYIITTTFILIIIVVFLWFHACVYLAILTHPFYPNSNYAVAYLESTGNYHAYLLDNGTPKDPQLLFLYISPSVDYYNPIFQTNSTKELLNRTYTW